MQFTPSFCGLNNKVQNFKSEYICYIEPVKICIKCEIRGSTFGRNDSDLRVGGCFEGDTDAGSLQNNCNGDSWAHGETLR